MKTKSTTLNISITPQLEAWIAEQLAAGWYNNASELVRDSLRLLRAEQQLKAAKLLDLQQAIEEGMQSPAAAWEGADAIKRIARTRQAAQQRQE
jgi:antitoxin ParD1/3/4